MKDCSPRCFDEATCSFPRYCKQIVGEEHFLFLSKLFWTSFKPETACDEWRMVDLQQNRNSLILWSSLDTRKQDCYCPYIGKDFEINDCDAKISFYEYTGILWIVSTLCEPKKRGETWVDFVSILYICCSGSSWSKIRKERFCWKCDGKTSCMEE